MAHAQRPDMLSTAQVARMFGVDPKTVRRWATTGKLESVDTPGGHRRFYAAEVTALLKAGRS